MIYHSHRDFNQLSYEAFSTLKDFGQEVESPSWQGIKEQKNFHEVLNLSLEWANLSIYESNEYLAIATKCNAIWAEEHFMERVSGTPYNPPPSHEIWPFNQNKNTQFVKEGTFDHTYPERFWPKHANQPNTQYAENIPRKGIRFDYGDLRSVIELLKRERYTRQAYIPIFFPEDTGAEKNQRIPCTIGYLINIRPDKKGLDRAHITYHIRSCDALRHFRDDVYLCVSLLLYIIDSLNLQKKSSDYTIIPGSMFMHIGSFHCFSADLPALNYEIQKLSRLI